MRLLLFVFTIFSILFLGCSKIDPKIEVPSYVEIDDYTVITDSTLQGTSNQKFTDVLVTTSTQNLGFYPLPCKIPIVKNGDTYLSIRPAVLVNGVKFLRLDYPMMKGCDTTLPLAKGQVLKLKPVFKYFSSVTFPLVEDFENTVNPKMANSNPSDTFCIKPDQANAAFGTGCMMIRLDAAHTVAQLQSVNGFTLSTTGSSTYLEFNYKGNYQIECGLIGSSSPGAIQNADQRSAGGANPSGAWKKMYINLTDIVRTPPHSAYYFLYFYTNTSFNPAVGSPQIFIDNVKVVRQ